MKLKFKASYYWIEAPKNFWSAFKKKGFEFDSGFWKTKDIFLIRNLIKYASDKSTINQIKKDLKDQHTEIESSYNTDSEIYIPCPDGLDYLPFQKAGIEMCAKKENVLLADEMGLGKTIQAIGVLNLLRPKRVLIICPATLKINWFNELKIWLTSKYAVEIADAKTPKGVFYLDGIFIINYDILHKFNAHLRLQPFDIIVVDESHYLQNPKARRTKEVLGYRDKPGIPGIKKMFLTGTPVLSRPKNIWPLLHALDPKLFSDYWTFADRYCGGYSKGRYNDYKGASNLEELNIVLRSRYMVRRLKKDVIKDLPDKSRQVIVFPKNEKVIKAEKTVRESMDFVSMSKYFTVNSFHGREARKINAVEKIPFVQKYLVNLTEQKDKIVVFGYHIEPLETLSQHFAGSALVMGKTSMKKRQKEIERFQKDPECKLFFGNIDAAGVGINLTVSDTVVYIEMDWTPAKMQQSEDRCHRIGQKNNVLIQYLVFDNSIDQIIAHSIIAKTKVIERIVK